MKANSAIPFRLPRHGLRPGCWSRTVLGLLLVVLSARASADLAWPEITRETRPWAYWWLMGSAVDTNNLSKELARYRDAGLGGVHIIPIYGAKGWESRYVTYLSPRWMEMLDFTVTEADRLGLAVDMTTGTGWCFGGPGVTDEQANAVMVSHQWSVTNGQTFVESFDRDATQALMAFGPEGRKEDLLGRISAGGLLEWAAPSGSWTVYAISQKPGPRKVKRAAPGGEGWMLNLAYPQAMTDYLGTFEQVFRGYQGGRPRAQYHDSYEYIMDWSPVLFEQFEQRRGYRLQDELNVFLSGEPADRAARLKCDYRETLSDIMVEETLPRWVDWSHANGFLTRNEAHGSPGNWLDLYAAADIPETEMFHKDRNKLISKFASSAAHVTGKRLVGAETGTWLAEHFTETLADMKYLLDDLFLSGVNHVLYHGTCYSPDEAPWPGWVFYASYEMNPRNSIWRDVGALNAYATRCQSVLQAGQPDNDVLLYWPIHDFWSRPEGMAQNLTVHARDWFEEQPVGRTAEALWNAGYQFDYVSDRQLARAAVHEGMIETVGGRYQVIVVPPCERLPLETVRQLLNLAKAGATVVFEDGLPSDISGAANLEAGRGALRRHLAELTFDGAADRSFQTAKAGRGWVRTGNLRSALTASGVARESLFDFGGLMCIRRAVADGRYYFVANRGSQDIDDWVPLSFAGGSVILMDPLTGACGKVAVDPSMAATATAVHLRIPPGGSIILRCQRVQAVDAEAWTCWEPAGETVVLGGDWQVDFLSGGPELPAPLTADRLASWTELGDTNALRFAGTACYRLTFNVPERRRMEESSTWQLDLGRVCQSARVRLNGRELGTLITPPFRVVAGPLKPTGNLLEVEVTNTSANRIRDLDRRGVAWQVFHDINFVNLDYKKFDASDWPDADSGLLGPVTLTPVRAAATPARAN